MSIDELFANQITEEIKELARTRLLEGGNLAPRGCDRRKAKLALLLVLEINRREVLTREEAAILYGITRDTLRNTDKAFPNPVNV